MAIITIPGGVTFPPEPLGVGLTSQVIDAASESVGCIFQFPKTGNVRKVHFATITVTTGATIDVRLETVDVTVTQATPSGTLWGTNTNNAAVVVGSGDDNTFFSVTLTADAAVTQGALAALVISNPAASFGNMQIAASNETLSLPYNLVDGPSWLSNLSHIHTFALEYDDGTIEPIWGVIPPSTTHSSTAVSTSTTPDCFGLRFQLPVPARIRGAWVYLDGDGDFNVRLVSTAYHQVNATGILASVSIDKDVRKNGGAGSYRVLFDTSYTIAGATNYRLIIEPTTTTSVTVRDSNTGSLLLLDGYPGGRNFHLTTAKDPTADGSWTNYNSGTFRVPLMGLLIDGFADDTGGASSGVPMSRIFTGY